MIQLIFDEKIKESPTLKFAQIARELNRQNKEIISLGLGEPGFDPPKDIKKAMIDSINSNLGKYSPSSGLYELRKLISEKLKKENNIITSPNNIVVTPGAKQALLLALMSILEPGDEVINISPSYVSYIPEIKIAEPKSVVKNIALQRNNFKLDKQAIKENITAKTKLIIINTPHNPTGKMFDKDEIDFIADICYRNNIFIISDEIYELLNFSEKKHISIGSYKKISEKVITINGFSKAYAMTGWRIGYLNAPQKIYNKCIKIQQHINTNTCNFVQYAAIAALKNDKSHINKFNLEIKEKEQILLNVFKDEIIKYTRAEGGFFAFLDISKLNISSNDFSSNLIKKHLVATTPGIAFGNEWDDHIRISMVTDVESFKIGVNFIKEYSYKLR